MGNFRMAAALAAAVSLGGCVSTEPAEDMSYGFAFMEQALGWTHHFTDYAAGAEPALQLEGGIAPLPAPLTASGSRYRLSGTNHSDDLFMYVRRYVTGLIPGFEHQVSFRVTFASNAPSGCVGIGGAPGESVVVKAGVAPVQPEPVLSGGEYRLSVDKGEQLQGGAHALVLGSIATGSTSCQATPWQLRTLDSGSRRLTVRADATGGAWLFVGVESGFEGRTTVYLTRIDAMFRRAL
jgi:hypothetical protein